MIRESVEYTNFDLGKILFKWNRTTDVDVHSSLSQYFQPNLYYRIELFESDEFNESPSDDRFVLAEINDYIFNMI